MLIMIRSSSISPLLPRRDVRLTFRRFGAVTGENRRERARSDRHVLPFVQSVVRAYHEADARDRNGARVPRKLPVVTLRRKRVRTPIAHDVNLSTIREFEIQRFESERATVTATG